MRYPRRLTQRDVLTMLRVRLYTVDAATGTVYRQNGTPMVPFPDKGDHLFVRLHWNKGRIGISLAKVVWMSVTNRVVPHGFEVHHRDEDQTNNVWSNLFCLYNLDHRKLHGADLLAAVKKEEEIPF
jgi:hypothetical protein